jgi:hypothetical protein
MDKRVNLDEAAAESHLEEMDLSGGANNVSSLRPKIDRTRTEEPQISLANTAGWKNIPFDSLPSKGMFYPHNSEVAIRSASLGEIRHWSTMDENDQISINDRLNFVLEKCVTFRIKDNPVRMDFRDLLVIDRFFLIFAVHELSFPNGENQMMKTFSCKSCPTDNKYVESLKVRSSMLQLFTLNDDIMHFYNDENRAFLVSSDKWDPFFMVMPTIGANEKVKAYVKSKKQIDEWFVRAAPYLIDDYRNADNGSLDALRMETLDWHRDKFMFVTKAVDLLEAGKSTSLSIRCPKCDKRINQDIFTSPSFTIKNLFIVSTRLIDLI